MRLYRCDDCGRIYEREEMDWTDQIYDQKDLRGFVYPVCPHCGSDQVEAGHSCDVCETNMGEVWMGDILVCNTCKEHILKSVTARVEALAKDEKLSFDEARDWIIGWAESVW